jgi:hypothetical protein
MKRILTSRSALERADAADLNRERAVHLWRHLDFTAPRRHTICSRSETRSGRSRISLADLSAPISPGQAYARAAAAAAGSGSFDSSLAFSPANTSTPLAGVGSMMPPPVLDAPIQQCRPAPEFLPPPADGCPDGYSLQHQSSCRRVALPRRRRLRSQAPGFSKLCEPRPPTPDQVALADRFRRIAASQPVNPSTPAVTIVQQSPQPASLPSQDDSFADSFFSTVLQNKSIIDSDFNDMGSLVDVSQPPLPPTGYSATKPAALFAHNVLPV